MNDQRDHNDELQAADERFLESLLQQVYHPDPLDRERRVRRVLNGLWSGSTKVAAVSVSGMGRSTRRRQRVVAAAIAATLLLAVGMVWQIKDPQRSAYATVHQVLQEAKQPRVREYRVSAQYKWPVVGTQTVESALFVRGANQFTLRHPSLVPGKDIWAGRDGDAAWIVPTLGPVVTGDPSIFDSWPMLHSRGASAPNLQLTTILEYLARHYDLELMANEELPTVVPSTKLVRCRHVRGRLREEYPGASPQLPRVIDLLANAESGVPRQLILDWQLEENQYGRSQIKMVLVGRPLVSVNWFEHEAHHAADRPVMTAEALIESLPDGS